MDIKKAREDLRKGKTIYDMPLKVVYYARVSTDKDDQLNSLENQQNYFEEMIAENKNWKFVRGYIDEGISGTAVKNRTQFLNMIEAASLGKIDLILTKEISRFSRNTVDSIKYTEYLLKQGTIVYFLSDNLNTIQEDAEFRLTIMSSLAQDEVRKLSERVKFGINRMIKERKLIGGNLTGYYKKDGMYQINEKEAPMIRYLFETYASGKVGLKKIGEELAEMGYLNRKGEPYSQTSMAKFLTNPRYKGFYTARLTEVEDYKTHKKVNVDKSRQIIEKDDRIPAIVSEELWDKANEILDAKSKKHDQINKNNKYNKFPFSGLMHCHFDGATFVRGTYQIGKGDRSRRRKFWACNNYRIHGKKKTEGCNSPVLYYEELVEVCKKILNMILVCQDDLISEINDMIRDIRIKKDYKKEIKLIDEKLFKTNNEKKELIMLRLRKEIALKEYNSLKDDLDDKINSLEENKRKLIEEEQNQESSEKNFEDFKKKINDMVLSDDEKILEIAQLFFEDIRVESIKDDETDQKVILHAKLNVSNSKDDTFDFNKFLLLFCTRQGCCFNDSRSCWW